MDETEQAPLDHAEWSKREWERIQARSRRANRAKGEVLVGFETHKPDGTIVRCERVETEEKLRAENEAHRAAAKSRREAIAANDAAKGDEALRARRELYEAARRRETVTVIRPPHPTRVMASRAVARPRERHACASTSSTSSSTGTSSGSRSAPDRPRSSDADEGDPPGPPLVECAAGEHCAEPTLWFTPSNTGKRGRPPKFHSHRCAVRADRARVAALRAAESDELGDLIADATAGLVTGGVLDLGEVLKLQVVGRDGLAELIREEAERRRTEGKPVPEAVARALGVAA